MIWKSTFREIKESLGRFLAILAIVALGVGFFAGLKGTQSAMLKTAQRYFDRTDLYDYRLISTVGFSEDEVETIKKQKDVKAAEGAVTFDIICESGGIERVLKMHSITEDVNRLVLFIVKIIFCNIRIFRGNTDHFVVLQKFFRTLRTADTHSTLSKAEIQDLISSALFLQQSIFSYNADICCPVVDISRYIRAFCQEKLQLLFFIDKDQLS